MLFTLCAPCVRGNLLSLSDILFQILEYMHTDVCVGGQPVLAVVLGDVVMSLRYSPHQIRLAIEKEKCGQKQVTKDFLMSGKEGTTVKRDVNSKRRKCDIIYQSKIDPGYLQQLISGIYYVEKIHTLCVDCLSCQFSIVTQPVCSSQSNKQGAMKGDSTGSHDSDTHNHSNSRCSDQVLGTDNMTDVQAHSSSPVPPPAVSTTPSDDCKTSSSNLSSTVLPVSAEVFQHTDSTCQLSDTASPGPADEVATVNPTDEVATVNSTDKVATVNPADEVATVNPADEVNPLMGWLLSIPRMRWLLSIPPLMGWLLSIPRLLSIPLMGWLLSIPLMGWLLSIPLMRWLLSIPVALTLQEMVHIQNLSVVVESRSAGVSVCIIPSSSLQPSLNILQQLEGRHTNKSACDYPITNHTEG